MRDPHSGLQARGIRWETGATDAFPGVLVPAPEPDLMSAA